MAYGAEIRAAYDDSMQLFLREPESAAVDELFPAPDHVSAVAIPTWRPYLLSETGKVWRDQVLEDPALVNWGIHVTDSSDSAMSSTGPELVGFTGFDTTDKWWYVDIFRQSSLGRGIGPRASQLALAYGFSERQIDCFVTYVYSGNTASIRMVEKMGMQFDGAFEKDPSQLRYSLEHPSPEAVQFASIARILGGASLTEVAIV